MLANTTSTQRPGPLTPSIPTSVDGSGLCSDMSLEDWFDLSPLPMCFSRSSDDFATTRWNGAWFTAFGFDPLSSQGKPGHELGIWVNPEQRAQMLGVTIEKRSAQNIDTEMRHADGEVRNLSLSTRTMRDSCGEAVLVSFFDVTELQRARVQVETLSEALEELRVTTKQFVQSETRSALGNLVADISNELNKPIGVGLTIASSLENRVSKFSSTLKSGVRRSELAQFIDDARVASEIITRNLTRVGSLVSHFNQAISIQPSSDRKQFQLRKMVDELLATLDTVFQDTGCIVEVDIAEEIYVVTYEDALAKVLTHLIQNSVVHAFGERRIGTIRIEARLLKDGKYLELRVGDNGSGIQLKDLRHVFEPFFSTRLGQGGTGVGLHIVHNIVTSLFGGSIDVLSEVGMGAIFILKMPRVAPIVPE